ncbi:MAG: helix-turn-helix domain-containing protein [Candidatus Limnocylindrales bacterium]
MASLEDVWKTVFPAARPVAPLTAEAAAREIAWVRVLKARIPAFDSLDPDDFAVIPATALAVVAPDRTETESLVADFQRARVTALLVIEADEPEAVSAAAALAVAASEAGLSAFSLAGSDPFAIERSIIGYLVNKRAELDRQAGRLEAILEHVALQGGGLEPLVATVAAFLGRAVALEGRRGTALAIHAPADTPAAAAAVAEYLAQPRRVALRVPLPGAPGPGKAPPPAPLPTPLPGAPLPTPLPGAPLAAPLASGASTPLPGAAPAASGSLALLGDSPATELERVATRRVAGFLALELARDTAVKRAQDAAQRADPLPPDGPPWVVLVARQAVGPDAETIEHREETRRELRLLASPRRLTLRGDADSLELRAILATDDADPWGLALAGRIAGFLGRCVAVSRPFDEPGSRALSEAEARATLESVERLPEPPPVVRADRLAAYRLLGSVRAMADGQELARAMLAPILVGSPSAQRERLTTLRAILDHPGLVEAAAALDLHRNTVAYRIHRIEELTGWDLSDPDLRLPLAIAARLVLIAQ